MNPETEHQREILIRMVEQIDFHLLSDTKLRKIISIAIDDEKKPSEPSKSAQIIMEDCLKKAQDTINNKEDPKIIPMTPYEENKWKTTLDRRA